MSRQHRHNNSLRRAILAQTGPEAFPYQQATPMQYDAQYNAYSGYGYSPYRSKKPDTGPDPLPPITDPGPQNPPITPDSPWPPPPKTPPKRYRMGRRRGRGRVKMLYGRKRQGFNGYGSWDAAGAILGPLFGAAGGATGAAITAAQQRKTQEAILAQQTAIQMAQIESEERSRMAEIAASIDAKTGGRGMTIALSVGVLALLGGGVYYVFRRRKKARK